MTVEHARTQQIHKPWGRRDLEPWTTAAEGAEAVGEVWFGRPDPSAPVSRLLLKLLFTTEPLSIQVHPDDAYARARGLASGKTEAWYVLACAAGATIALGLRAQVGEGELRAAIGDGSIVALVRWEPVFEHDVILIPAGTIHALGAGLVVAEIQQRCDSTFRLFDFGRARELHVDDAVAAAHAGPARRGAAPRQLSGARTLLATSPHFVLERLALPPSTAWKLDAGPETWLLVIEGQALVGEVHAGVGEAVFLEEASARIVAGAAGMTGLLAYAAAGPAARLLERLDAPLAAAVPGRFPPPLPQPVPACAGLRS